MYFKFLIIYLKLFYNKGMDKDIKLSYGDSYVLIGGKESIQSGTVI